jgi:hypothetical protein
MNIIVLVQSRNLSNIVKFGRRMSDQKFIISNSSVLRTELR